MISFHQVQAKTVELLNAKAELAGVEVVADLGSDADEGSIEAALDSSGVAISVTVPVSGKTVSQQAGRVVLNCTLLVLIAVNPERNNPEKNSEAIGLGIYDLLQHAVAAVLSPADPHRPLTETDRFGLAEDALHLDVLDSGIFRYQLNFTKRCVL